MAQFRATIEGQGKGIASHLGSKKSGIVVNVNGWHSGVRISGRTNEAGTDVFDIYATGGSDGSNRDEYVGTVIYNNVSGSVEVRR